MKTMKIKMITVFALALLFSLNANIMAQQQGYGQGNRKDGNFNQQKGFFCKNIPNLTEDQQTKIEKLRTAHMKDVLDHRNQMGEKRAKLQTLQTADNVNMDEINILIEEMGKIRIEKQKKAAAHRQSVRNLLTDEQKVYFDS
ncbi:MAG: Spy/CpxP family protein refolding chaperone, partial [Bacteroidales bacterium]|nr:Spy/CpxP family protein refolding chaperone [Bacteroidales bacterium]